MSSRTVRTLLAAAIASSAAVPGAIAAPPPPPPEYAMVELSVAPGTAGWVYDCSETRATLRAIGYVNGNWSKDDGTNCNGTVPVYWDVAGTATPVAPVLLPKPRADKPANVKAISPDGRSIAGDAWARDAGSCGSSIRPRLLGAGCGRLDGDGSACSARLLRVWMGVGHHRRREHGFRRGHLARTPR